MLASSQTRPFLFFIILFIWSVVGSIADKMLRAARANDRVIAQPAGRPPDLGGTLGADAFGEKVAEGDLFFNLP
jgi:hypothetical protein